MKDSPQLPILNRSVILDCFSPQDDATVKCWGQNGGGDANGLCPPSSSREFFIDNSLVRIRLINEIISVDRPCAMGV